MIEPQLVVRRVHLLQFEVGQAYVWEWSEGLTLIDTGIAGSAEQIVHAIETIGHRPEAVREIVLTHYHADHVGGAAEFARRTSATVIAHRSDAGVIGGGESAAPPVLTERERPLAKLIFPKVPPAEPVHVDREVTEGDLTAGGGTIVRVPGHTPGSIAVLVSELGVLFTGDVIASYEGRPVLGPFNIDRLQAVESVRNLSSLEFEVACFGHGAPLVGGASERIQALASTL